MFADENELRKVVKGIELDDAPRPKHQADLRQQVLTAFDNAGAVGEPPRQRRKSVRLGRKLMQNRSIQIVAASVVAACVIVVVLWSIGPGAGVTLAQVRELVEQAKTVCYELTSYRNDQDEGTANVMYMEPGKMRVEWPGMVGIFDWERGEILALITEEKLGHLTVVTDMDNPYHRNWLSDLKAIMGSDAAKELERRELAGRDAKGWQVLDEGWMCTVWADATTGDLLQVEWQHGSNRMVMGQFVLDRDLDESLFSMTLPDGYTLATKMEMTEADPSEADILALLRVWASGNGGQFPDKLDPSKFAAAAAKADWYGDLGIDSHEKAQAMNKSIGRAFYLLHSWELEWNYVGQGVKRGQANKPVFWYRPVGSKTYRVIYADFNVGELSPEQLDKLEQDTTGDDS